ncbi:isopropylmalate isomerase [Antarctobacter jejuensis]|uniref:isopropylmalate isomerase n=1 Tax=Antarctobacter jejuensis TaxID=1439938 RepID=UPI003FD50E7F
METINLAEVMACVGLRWSPQIGDPSVMGWATVVAYGTASGLCLWAAILRRTDRRFWLVMSLILAFLCVNKQLDLQSALTATGRCIAQMQGWYENRRTVQMAFIAGLVLIGLSTFLLAAIRLAPALHRVGIALLGFGVLIVFVAVRAVGMHHVDQIINLRLGGARMNWILELSGIILIILNATAAVIGAKGRRHRTDRAKAQLGE